MATIPSPFSLTKNETVLFNHLDNFAQQQCPPIECRIAGGWVRDKVSSDQTAESDLSFYLYNLTISMLLCPIHLGILSP